MDTSKENQDSTSQKGKLFRPYEDLVYNSPVRTPLKDLPGSNGNYCNVTPVAATNTLFDVNVALGSRGNTTKSDCMQDTDGVMLNSLLLKKLNEVLDKAKKEYESKLQEKDEIIYQLTHSQEKTEGTPKVTVFGQGVQSIPEIVVEDYDLIVEKENSALESSANPQHDEAALHYSSEVDDHVMCKSTFSAWSCDTAVNADSGAHASEAVPHLVNEDKNSVSMANGALTVAMETASMETHLCHSDDITTMTPCRLCCTCGDVIAAPVSCENSHSEDLVTQTPCEMCHSKDTTTHLSCKVCHNEPSHTTNNSSHTSYSPCLEDKHTQTVAEEAWESSSLSHDHSATSCVDQVASLLTVDERIEACSQTCSIELAENWTQTISEEDLMCDRSNQISTQTSCTCEGVKCDVLSQLSTQTTSTESQTTYEGSCRDVLSQVSVQTMCVGSQTASEEGSRCDASSQISTQTTNAESQTTCKAPCCDASCQYSLLIMSCEAGTQTVPLSSASDSCCQTEEPVVMETACQTILHLTSTSILEESDRFHQLISAHALIKELQAELQEYLSISDSVISVEHVQRQVSDVLRDNQHKLMEASRRLQKKEKTSQAQVSAMMLEMEESRRQMKKLYEENEQVLTKYDQIMASLESSRISRQQMEILYKTTQADLQIAREDAEKLKCDLLLTQKDLAEKSLQSSELQTTLNATNEEVCMLKKEIESKEKSLESQKKEICSLEERICLLTETHEEKMLSISETSAKLRENVCSLEASIKQKDTEIVEVKSELDNTRTCMEEEIQKLSARISSQEQQLSDNNITIGSLQERLQEEEKKAESWHQLQTAQALIQELQGEVQEFTSLEESLKMAEEYQTQIQHTVKENVLQLTTAVQRLRDSKMLLEREKRQFEKQKLVQQRQISVWSKDYQKMKMQYEEMTVSMETAQRALQEMDGLPEEVDFLKAELQATREASKERETDQEERLNKLTADYEQSCQEVENLQRTLDFREEDISQLERELYDLRELMAAEQKNLADTKKQLTVYHEENERFRESSAKNEVLISRLRDLLSTSNSELDCIKASSSRLLHQQESEIEMCREYVDRIYFSMNQVLKGLKGKVDPQTTEEEVLQGKLDPQTTEEEITPETPQGTSDTESHSCKSFLSEIFQAAGDKTLTTPPVTRPSNLKVTFLTPTSEAVASDSTPGDEDSDFTGIVPLPSSSNETSPATASRLSLGYSANSAFAPVSSCKKPKSALKKVPSQSVTDLRGYSSCTKQAKRHLDMDNDTRSQSLLQRLKSVVDPSSRVLSVSKGNHDNVMSPGVTNEDSLMHKLSKVDTSLREIIRLGNIIEKASQLSLGDLRAQVDAAQEQLQGQKVLCREHQSQLQIQREEMEKQAKVIASQKSKMAEVVDKLEKRYDQETAVKDLTQQTAQLKVKVQSLEEENTIMKEEINAGLLRLQAGNGSQLAASVDENLKLKLKLTKLREQFKKKDEYYEDLAKKASKRMKVFEENWKKAEAEVYRFDELVQIIRKTLTRREDLVQEHNDLKKLMNLINGEKSLPSDLNFEPLKPVKTVKW